MIPVSLGWDTQRRSILLKWDGFISSGWDNGKISAKILGYSIPIPLKKEKIQLEPTSHTMDLFERDFFFSHKMEA
jgi:hypothetical protein